LASYDRKKLKDNLLNSPNFRRISECAEYYQLVQKFFDCEYAQLVKSLSAMCAEWQYDRLLASELENLVLMILNRTFVQYCLPLKDVDLSKMAGIFGLSMSQLVNHLTHLILSNELHARIDLHTQQLVKHEPSQRNAVFKKACDAAEDLCLQQQLALMRISLIENGIRLKKKDGEAEDHNVVE